MEKDLFSGKQNELKFCLYQDDDERLEFVFYPEDSETYYQDYRWAIIHRCFGENPEDEDITVRFGVFEECSMLGDLVHYIKTVIENKQDVRLFTIGNVDCEIRYKKRLLEDSETLIFYFFDINSDVGIRLYLSPEAALEFGEWCAQINEYMQTYYPYDKKFYESDDYDSLDDDE